MLTRLPNWQSALSSYLLSVAQARFQYGSLDCGLFVADAILAISGVDVAEVFRGKYSTRAEAFALVRTVAGRATMEAVAHHLSRRFDIHEVGVLRAERGDPVMLRSGRTSLLGIVAMHGTEILSPCTHGIRRLPLSHATRAWHI